MRTLTADTWGIAGPTFLGIYAVLAVAALLITVLLRRALAQGRVDPRWEPGPEELGYINGGDRQAVTVSLAGLRAANAVSVGSDGAIAVIGSSPPAPSELTWAVYQAAQQRPVHPVALAQDRTLRPALEHLRDTLVRRGWLLSPRRRTAMRLAALPMVAVLTLGIARVVAGLGAGKPVAFLVMLTVLVGLFVLPMLAVSPRSRAGQSAMARMRAAHIRLDPRTSASAGAAASAFGVGGAALAVGLFGAAALWSADPALAAETDLGRLGSSSSGGDSGGGDSGGSSSCGGGGGGCGGGGGGCGG